MGWANLPLIAALTAVVTAQAVKVPWHYMASGGKWRPALAFGTGGMPSSHSAAVTSLATVVGMQQGWSSSVFAIAAVVSAITMYDAAGIRRHAGIQASAINRVVKSLSAIQRFDWASGEAELKELLGHRPVEVVGGALWGVAVGMLFALT